MESLEYIAEILPDGHLPVPEEILKKLPRKLHSKLHIKITPAENIVKKKSLAEFYGAWQDDREAEEIVQDIYNSRILNSRSERTTHE
ncbi:hypothetical protein JW935_05560 [candidate division KSB1 bacterium]|nr:hypothetical protein [candidate division KSB1 bacterium]